MRRSRCSGFTLVELLVVIAIIGTLIGLLLPAVQMVREAVRRSSCSNNLHQMAVAVQAYRAQYNCFPPGRFKSNVHRWSQHARLLPFLQEANVSVKIDYHSSPGSAVNMEARMSHIAVFRCPSDTNRMRDPYKKNHYGWGKNNYKGNAGNDIGLYKNGNEQNNGIFMSNIIVKDAEIFDGDGNTALFAEAVLGDGDDQTIEIPGDWFRIPETHQTRNAVYNACKNVEPGVGPGNQICRSGRNWVWGNYIPTRYNHVMPPNTASCCRRDSSSGDLDAKVNDKGGATTASSYHPGGVNVVMCDASGKFINESIDIETWWALGSRDGEEVIRRDF